MKFNKIRYDFGKEAGLDGALNRQQDQVWLWIVYYRVGHDSCRF